MKNKAFTLIELLAVIVILAIIALIATPIVLNIIDNTKKSAFKESIEIVSKAGQLYYTEVLLKNNEGIEEKIFEFPDSVEGLKIDQKKTLKGIMKVRKDGSTTFALNDGVYCAKKGYNDKNIDYNKDIENCIIRIQIEDISLKSQDISMIMGNTVTIEPKIFPSAATNKKLKWTSLDTSIATVENGVVTGISSGNTIVTVETMDGSNISKTINIVVEPYTNGFLTSTNNCIFRGKICPNGTEINVKVNESENYDFYVIKDTGSKLTLIMDRNLGDAVAWVTETDYINAGGQNWTNRYGASDKGPITALNALESRTQGWVNVPLLTYTLSNDLDGLGGTSTYPSSVRRNKRSRLITYTEICNLCNASKGSTFDCPAYLINTNHGYWFSTVNSTTSYYVYQISNYGRVDRGYYSAYYNVNGYGVRPVIDMTK